MRLKALEQRRTCKKCGFAAPEEWFLLSRNTSISTNKLFRRSDCPMCLQETRDKAKNENRALSKARSLLARHAKKYRMKPQAFARRFNWEVHQIAHDIIHSSKNACPYCNFPYEDMGNGLRDITLDIVNPQEQPYYQTNTKFCCSTCNSIKGQRGADAFGLHLTMVKQRSAYLKAKFGTLEKPQYKMELTYGS
ncbi:hypothetical protein LCGC14_1543710 [marine sediment metagenome]|uniref:Uncharacterized protein n=1 Tax=marine sediment metagenome TaxID=412755 RepID=A0A0F9IS76_9ZZZZ